MNVFQDKHLWSYKSGKDWFTTEDQPRYFFTEAECRKWLKSQRIRFTSLRPPKVKYRPLVGDFMERLELVQLEGEDMETFQLQFQHGKCPKGFVSVVGQFEMCGGFIHSDIYDTRLIGRGIGTRAYMTILKKYGKLKTSYHNASREAQALWRKLVKIFPYETEFFTPQIEITWVDVNYPLLPLRSV